MHAIDEAEDAVDSDKKLVSSGPLALSDDYKNFSALIYLPRYKQVYTR